MLAEAVEDRRCLGGSELSAFALTGNGAGDFNGGDAGDVDQGGCALPRDAANPSGTRFLNLTLDQCARIDEIPGHYRRSRMMVSERGSPLIVIGTSSGSSSSISWEGSGSDVIRPRAIIC
jgi:hypothetical protein